VRHALALALAVVALAACAGAGAAQTAEPAGPARLVVIGATARSSQAIIPQALARGHAVVAVARRPAEVATRHERLTVLQGDVYDRASLEAAIGPGDVVICMVGPRVDPFREVPPMDLFTAGTRNIIAAMKAKDSRRLLIASSIGVENEFPAEKPDAMKEPGRMWLWNSRWLYKDMRDMEDIVRSSGLDWVILRPAFMEEGPARHDLEFAVNRDSPKQRTLTYEDFATFVLDQVAGDAYLGDTVGVYGSKPVSFTAEQNAEFRELVRKMQEKAAQEEAARK
jgi:putative NADH-flavin reductase